MTRIISRVAAAVVFVGLALAPALAKETPSGPGAGGPEPDGAADTEQTANPKRAKPTRPQVGKPKHPGLLFTGLNRQGVETWVRVTDGAPMVRVPRGFYLARPYEGDGTTEKPVEVHVDGYFIDVYEVTNERAAKFLNATELDPDVIKNRKYVSNPKDLIVRSADGHWRVKRGREHYPAVDLTGLPHSSTPRGWAAGCQPRPSGRRRRVVRWATCTRGGATNRRHFTPTLGDRAAEDSCRLARSLRAHRPMA